jgi:hypothetical protein
MATQYEELALTVSLNDQASAGLAKLNAQLAQLGAGPNIHRPRSLRRESEATIRDLQD